MASTHKQQTKHFWSEHLEQWYASGLSQAAYCRKHNLCQQKFSYRKRQADVCVDKPEGSTGFARVEVNPLISSVSGDVSLSLRFNETICIEGITTDNMMLIQPLLSLLR